MEARQRGKMKAWKNTIKRVLEEFNQEGLFGRRLHAKFAAVPKVE
jgi:hypothetical protein